MTLVQNDIATAHGRYLQIYKLIHERDEELARAFNNPRRSSAILQLVHIYALGLVSEDEMQAFTPSTRNVVQALGKPNERSPGNSSA